MKITDVMNVFISVNGENRGCIEVCERIQEHQFMQKVREVTGMKDLEMKEDLDLRLLVQDEVINFSLPYKLLSKIYLEDIKKCNIKSFVQNEDPDLLAPFLDVFDIDTTLHIDGYSALMYSSMKENTEMVKLLIKRGANLEIKDRKYKNTALNLACSNRDMEIIEILVNSGADIETKDCSGMTPLNNALFENCIELAKLLIKKGANIESRDGDGMTPLNRSSTKGDKELVELLIDSGANIESRNGWGMTPLNSASIEGYKEIVELLLNEKADLESKDCKGMTALDNASLEGYTEIVKLLDKK